MEYRLKVQFQLPRFYFKGYASYNVNVCNKFDLFSLATRKSFPRSSIAWLFSGGISHVHQLKLDRDWSKNKQEQLPWWRQHGNNARGESSHTTFLSLLSDLKENLCRKIHDISQKWIVFLRLRDMTTVLSTRRTFHSSSFLLMSTTQQLLLKMINKMLVSCRRCSPFDCSC